jgi:hypothetical protein
VPFSSSVRLGGAPAARPSQCRRRIDQANYGYPPVLDTLNIAFIRRRPVSVFHRSDQRSQYTLLAFGLQCVEASVRPSLGSFISSRWNASFVDILLVKAWLVSSRSTLPLNGTNQRADVTIFVSIGGTKTAAAR